MLDLSKQTALKILVAGETQLTSLILNSQALTNIQIHVNNISEFEMEKIVNSLPVVTNGFFSPYQKNELEHNVINRIQWKKAVAKGWNVKDIVNEEYQGSEPSEEYLATYGTTGITIDATNFPDENFRNWLLDAANISGYGQDAVLTDEEIADIKKIDVDEKGIKTLKGIEHFTALEVLFCNKNNLSALDLSQNTKLIALQCDHNSDIAELDVSKNTELEVLYCGFLSLTSIDLSKNTKLTVIGVSGDKLTSLDVSMLPELDCIMCSNNQLTSLDVSKNPKLTQLLCDENQLTTLDLSNNPILWRLHCQKNLIRGASMDALVNSLPTVAESEFRVYKEEDPTGNEMTDVQVAAARAKGWQPLYFDANDGTYGTWKDYEGTSGISTLKKEQLEGEWYTLDGRRVEKPTRKGVYINNGKVVIK